MNNVIKPNTYIKVLSQDHLDYIIGLAEDNGWKRWQWVDLSRPDTNFIFFHEGMDYTFNKSNTLPRGWEEIFIPLPNTNPVPPFKIRNANHPAVRQWLKDMGYITYNGRSIDVIDDNVEFILIERNGSVVWWDVRSSDIGFNAEFAPELTLNLDVTAWSLPEPVEPVDPAKQERAERIKVIEAELAKLKAMD